MTTLHSRSFVRLVLLSVGALFAGAASAAEIELLSGAKVEGRTISKDDKRLKVEVEIGGKKYIRDYPLEKIHAVTIGEKRYVINEMPVGGPPKLERGKPRRDDAAETAKSGNRRSRAEVEALINEQGRAPPDWYDATPLSFPKSLDLSFPEKAPGAWNNQVNVNQYIWDVLNPNPPRWKEGTRFVHHLLDVHKDEPEKRTRAMNTLGRFYHDLLEDYPRAAFWWQQAGVHKGNTPFTGSGSHLASCYYRLGNKEMAVELLGKLPGTFAGIKVLGEIGEPKKAAQLSESYVRAGSDASLAYMYAADSWRTNGELAKAVELYQQVLNLPAEGQAKGRIERNQRRARSSLDAIKLFELLDLQNIPDGVFQAECLGYEGAVRVAVTVRASRIEDVKVVNHREKQFYSSMSDTAAKIIAKQHVKGGDVTSSATLTSEAIINATAKALADAAKGK